MVHHRALGQYGDYAGGGSRQPLPQSVSSVPKAEFDNLIELVAGKDVVDMELTHIVREICAEYEPSGTSETSPCVLFDLYERDRNAFYNALPLWTKVILKLTCELYADAGQLDDLPDELVLRFVVTRGSI